jgi:hypothetical protein
MCPPALPALHKYHKKGSINKPENINSLNHSTSFVLKESQSNGSNLSTKGKTFADVQFYSI